MHQIKVLLTILLLSGYIAIFAQKTFPIEGIADSRDELYALTNAIIIKSPTERIENATLLIRKGKIESLGKAIVIPKDAITIDVKGKYIYPSFIDIYSNYGLPEVKAEVGGTRSEQALSTKQGAFSWSISLLIPMKKPRKNFARLALVRCLRIVPMAFRAVQVRSLRSAKGANMSKL
jgi:hypothetical protein